MDKIVQHMVPFVAVARAVAFNKVSMRYNKFQYVKSMMFDFLGAVSHCTFVSFQRESIGIMDEYGDVHGRSVAAGSQSLGQVELTRIALPMPSKLCFI